MWWAGAAGHGSVLHAAGDERVRQPIGVPQGPDDERHDEGERARRGPPRQLRLPHLARPARAEVVKVRAESTEDEFALDIEDDGIGIPQAKLTGQHSYGLTGMAERAEGLGGELQITVPPGRGTNVILRLALTEPRKEVLNNDSVAYRG